MNRWAAAVSAVLFCSACGSIGPPLPPALNLPARVTDLTAVQRGASILIAFTMPAITTEGMPIQETPETDLRIGRSGRTFEMQPWLATARRLPDQGKHTEYKVAATPYTGQDVVVAVRLNNARGRGAGWSNFVALSVTAPVSRPENLKAEPTANGVKLSWTHSTAPLYRVYRKEGKSEPAPLGDAKESPYLDTTAEFGKTYTYYVEAAAGPGEKASQSEPSESVTVAPEDVFAPAVPAGLKTVVGTRSVEVSWNRNAESDFAEYCVFRSEGNGPFILLTCKLTAPSYSDRDVKPAGRYRYEVSAVDKSGNESDRSAAAEAALP